MKNFVKSFGIIALAAVIGFSMTACGDNGNGDGLESGVCKVLDNRTRLEFSGQVYEESYSDTGSYYEKFTGDLEIIEYLGGSGEIINGKLNYSIGVPDNSDLINFSYLTYNTDLFYDYDYLGCSDNGAKFAVIEYLVLDCYDYYMIARNKWTIKTNAETYEGVTFIYADRNVTLSADGKIENHPAGFTMVIEDLELVLLKGWNTVYIKKEYSANGKVTTTLGNPSLLWTIQ